MAEEARLAGAFTLALLLTGASVPLAIRLARRTEFFDHPVGYKQHRRATPYLGGAAVAAGLLPAAIAFGDALGDYAVLIACVAALFVLGTIDDRIALGVGPRVTAEVGCAVLLHFSDLGWYVFANEAANLAITIALVLGVVNAYNLMDNLDGAAGTVALVSAVALGIYAATLGLWALAAIGFALAGACAGFLPSNLARPSGRIFLGDGGSMPIGLLIAALIMNLPAPPGFGWELMAATVVLVGLPALDTSLVIFSRLRRGLVVHQGGRDHISHRLYTQLGSARRVAIVLALGQAALAGLAIGLLHLGDQPALAGSIAAMVVGAGVIFAVELPELVPRRALRNRSTA